MLPPQSVDWVGKGAVGVSFQPWATSDRMRCEQMDVVGHRGCKGILPENTIPGFVHALALGVDFIECDVHLTKDGRLAVIHDGTVDRTTNGTGPVAEMTLAELKELDAGCGYRIPALEEVLEVARPGDTRLLIELKADRAVDAAVRMVVDSGMVDRVSFSSAYGHRLREVQRLMPQARTLAIFPRGDPDAVEQALALGAVGCDLVFTGLRQERVAKARDAGLEVCIWNPDTEEDQRAAIALGPDRVSSNFPDRLLRILGRPVPAVFPQAGLRAGDPSL